ncbi:MAG: hypothetical protein KKF16_01230 [Euryarchaeota archaeon]|nr:hypothetical protein [Euryarchaeota archaeon]MBU4607766.1 hypothetical protein [Euryarchaeota archaeon]MBV1729334.1 hypothetical protein [Methanobacterium sp.]MBV1755607.1 hypothetical protein [Methanobacterium sp.]
MKRQCKICGRDIGADAPDMTCWTCHNKQLTKKKEAEKKAAMELEEKKKKEKIERAQKIEKQKIQRAQKIEIIKKERCELALKLFNEENLQIEKILLFMEPYGFELRKGITIETLSRLMGIGTPDCRVLMMKLITGGKAYKICRFCSPSLYYLK